MADTQAESGEQRSDKQGSDKQDRDERGSDQPRSEAGNDDQKDNNADEDDKLSPLERYPIVRYVFVAALVAGIIAAIAWYMNYRASGQYLQSTNNAYVRADFVTVSPKVGGYVERVLVADNQPVRRGQLLAVLDPRDYRANVEQAQAQIAAAAANIRAAQRTFDEQQAGVGQAAAQVASAEAAAVAAEREVQRYEPLARSGAESRERLANLVLQRDRAAAELRA